MVDNIATHIKQSDYDAIIFTVFKNKPDSNFIRSLDWHKCSSEADVALPPQFKPFVTHNNVFSRAAYSSGFMSFYVTPGLKKSSFAA
jgi:hypothetical protein